MKRVLHILSSLERSGMEMMLLSSAGEWDRRGYRCDVLSTASNAGPVAPAMQESGYGVFHIPFRSRWRYLPRLRLFRDYWRLCSSGYDIVHIHTEAATLLFAVIAKFAGVSRLAITPHNTFRFSGILRARKFIERFVIRTLGGRYGMISNDVEACEWERYRNHGIRTWNWIDTSHYQPPTESERTRARRNLQIRDDTFVMVSVGNCNKAKNHEAILRALPLINDDIPVCYLHVGKESEERSERKLAKDLAIDSRIRFLGSQPDPLPYLWAADAFVMPSFHEGLGMAAVEAIAAAVPAVLSQTDGLSEVAKEAQSAVLTTTEPYSVAQAITQLTRIPYAERRSRVLADSDRVRERFSARNGVQSIVTGLYEGGNPASAARLEGGGQ